MASKNVLTLHSFWSYSGEDFPTKSVKLNFIEVEPTEQKPRKMTSSSNLR